MKNKIIYVLHKSGANSHYSGLAKLCEKNGYEVRYHEFSVVGTLFKSLLKLNFTLFSKQIQNAVFLSKLPKNKNFKVVLGIAPYDYKLPGLLQKLKNHQIYYHTSWTCWDGSFYPNKKNITPNLIENWKEFIEKKAKHIFAVSEKTKSELIANYKRDASTISVVYHSLDNSQFHSGKSNQQANGPLEFMYAGRLIPNKGLEELLEFFAQNPDKTFKIAGKGKLSERIKEFAQKHSNIHFLGQISSRNVLAQQFGSAHYLILNSKKSGKWEELFGMVLIEAMACGAIPIATKHTGPLEIIQNESDGFLVEENEMIEFLKELNPNNYSIEMKNKAIVSAEKYKLEQISQRWQAILED